MHETNISELSNEDKLAIVCLYYARLKSNDERYKGYTSTLRTLAQKYGVKYKTLTNNKDLYDAQFDNGRAGWHQRPIEKQNKHLFDLYNKYKTVIIEELEKLANNIIEDASVEGAPYFSIKTKDEKTVKAILAKEENVEFDGLNILKDLLTLGQLVFIVFGGDKPSWKTGLVGMGVISKLPYDVGYSGKNYKIRVDIKLLLDNPIKREDLVPYKDTYDIIGIGPITKWEPNQAISQIQEKNAVALMRAMLEINPNIENELSALIDESLMTRVKGAATKYIPVEANYGEDIANENETGSEVEMIEKFSDKYLPEIKEILDGLSMDKRPIETLTNFINSGKHIILNGPPGTGKTTIAERASDQAVKTNYISGYIMTTAIADWSTFDTIGGYMPDKTGNLTFQEGVFLKSIRENKWLIIDEINRAEVDKAFGHFFTVLSGKSVELQYKADTPSGERNIKIDIIDKLISYYDYNDATYYIGRNWRILATMNTYDKNSLFMLSYAFMRRFSFIYIPVPNEDEFKFLIKERISGREDIVNKLISIIKSSPKKLGAAIIIDIIDYLENSDYNNIIDGICALVIPQYEGISLQQIKQLFREFGTLFDESDRNIFRVYLCEFFDIRESELLKIKFTDIDQELTDEESE